MKKSKKKSVHLYEVRCDPQIALASILKDFYKEFFTRLADLSKGEHKVKKNKKLYYFAHTYTVKDKDGNYVPEGEDANFHLANYRASRLLLAGYNIYSPISHTHPIHRACPEFLAAHEHELWYELDLAFIACVNFTGIILAPDWEQSTGCKLEYNWFNAAGKEILFYKDIIK